MRLLHLYSGNLAFGGIETLLKTLARHRSGCPELDQHFALCFEGNLSQELRDIDVPVSILGSARLSRPWTIWRVRTQLNKLLKTTSFDVVVCHSTWVYAIFAPVIRKRGLRLGFWAHAIKSGKKNWMDYLARQTPADFVLANSHITNESVTKYLFPQAPSEVYYLPVEFKDVGDRNHVREEVRRSLQTSPEDVVIIQACRMDLWKGHASLVRALGRLASNPRWKCWIAGSPQRPDEEAYLRDLQETAKRLGIEDRIQFLGHRRDVPRLLAAADIHCQPNTNPEPFGIAFVEALYAGLPVVTTAMGGALEIVEDDSCGILVPPQDERVLPDALSRLIDDPDLRMRLGNAGPARAHFLCDRAMQMARFGQIVVKLSGHRSIAAV